MRRERENNLKRQEDRGWRERRMTERGRERRKKERQKRKNMKLKFTLTDYISDELARHVRTKVQQYENRSSIKLSLGEKEKLFLK